MLRSNLQWGKLHKFSFLHSPITLLDDFIQSTRSLAISLLDRRRALFAAKASTSTLIACSIRLSGARGRRCVDRAVQNLHALNTRAPALILRPSSPCRTRSVQLYVVGARFDHDDAHERRTVVRVVGADARPGLPASRRSDSRTELMRDSPLR
jgi:hypothetical protein